LPALLLLITALGLHAPTAVASHQTDFAPDREDVAPDPDTPAFDLTVDSVEVTQATQTRTNSIPLVARRSTGVRAKIGVDDLPQTLHSVAGVTGTLHVFANGAEVTPASGISPINAPFTVRRSPDRNKENHTLNFELLAPTAITASTDVDFRVDLDPAAGEADANNNSGSANDLTAVERRTPFIFYTRIDYTPSGLGPPDPGRVAPGTGDAFVRGILPVDDSDRLLYRETAPLTFGFDPNGNRTLDESTDPEQRELLDRLEERRQEIIRNHGLESDRVFLYGWIAGNPIDGNGACCYARSDFVNGSWVHRHFNRVGFGNTADGLYQRTFAHELAHMFGLRHNNGINATGTDPGLDETGWDVGRRLDANPAGNNEIGRVKPITRPVAGPDFDIMTTGVPPTFPTPRTNEAWINTKHYKFLLNHCTLAQCLKVAEREPEVISRRLLPEPPL
jgi:hypothetical protein